MLDTTVPGELADLIGPSESDRENWRRITGCVNGAVPRPKRR